jgi:hypothetical protein
MSQWDPYQEAITRIAPPFSNIEFQRGTIVHAPFAFGKHYAVVWRSASEQTVELLVISSKPHLASSRDCVEVTPSNAVPFKKRSYIKCDEIHSFPIENLETVYSGLLPQNHVSEIEALLERG